jgi:hypothetical protein
LEGYKQGFVSGREFYFFLNLMVVAFLLACWARWREITPALVMLCIVYLAVRHSRHAIFLAITFGAYMPVLLTAYFRELSGRPGFMAWIHRLGRRIPALVVILLICLFAYKFVSINPLHLEVPSQPSLVGKTGPYYPVGAIDFIEQRQLSGKLLVHYDWGEYCLWRLYPRCLVAIDGRYETVYPESLHKEYFDFLMARKDWRKFLEHYPPDLILIDIRSQVHGLLSGDPGWRQVYADPGCALFRRQAQLAPRTAQTRSQP